MSFSIPHSVINNVIPSKSNADPANWQSLVKRADQLNMDRKSCSYSTQKTQNNGYADGYEGKWLSDWSQKCGERLYKQESDLIPLFHEMTQKPDGVKKAWSDYNFAPVKWKDVSGEHCGVDLQELAKRIATTNIEANDGDPTLVEFEALSDAHEAHTPAEQKAINEILERYFSRTAIFKAFSDGDTGVKVAFKRQETPHAIETVNDDVAKYWFKAKLEEVQVNAPKGARVTVVPRDSCGNWLTKHGAKADVGANGKVEMDLSCLPKEAESLAIYVLHDKDGNGPKMPELLNRLDVQLPNTRFHKKIDKAERRANLGCPSNC